MNFTSVSPSARRTSRRLRHCLASVLWLLVAVPTAWASEVTIPHTFVANTPAVAAEVNANFGAVDVAVDDNAVDIAELQSAMALMQSTIDAQATMIAGLQTNLAALQGNSVLALDGALELVADPATGQPTARFVAVNVQVVNGLAVTNTTNGVGNLIVGYNEEPGGQAFCSNGDFVNQMDCENQGGTWAANQRTGSHNIIVGNKHAYTRAGGLLAGYQSIVNGEFGFAAGSSNTAGGTGASVTGGIGNTARGDSSSISGGVMNSATGYLSSISGGSHNRAIGLISWVGGGRDNTAFAAGSSVSGGFTNTASGDASSVSGGANNAASGHGSSVSAGFNNVASGINSSVSGGTQNLADGTSSSVSGGISNTASEFGSSVNGGRNNTASGEASSVDGGNTRTASGTDDWVAGGLFEDN